MMFTLLEGLKNTGCIKETGKKLKTDLSWEMS